MTQCSDASSATSSAAQRIALLVDCGPEIDELLDGVFARENWSVQRVPDNCAAPLTAAANPFDLIVNGKMTGGFAVVAFPAVYCSSGVKTFIVNQHGMIYEKDLGPKTSEIASAMKAYDHDVTWARVRPTNF